MEPQVEDDMIDSLQIQSLIYEIRGQRVMLDSDLAQLYGVETKILNKAVKRNIEKFPPEFMFQLTNKEVTILKFQNGTSSWGGPRYLPYAFTEHGVLMTANILNSDRANIISVEIIKVFIKLRNYVLSNMAVLEQVSELKQLLTLHIENTGNKLLEHTDAITQIIEVLNSLIDHPKQPKKIGFEK